MNAVYRKLREFPPTFSGTVTIPVGRSSWGVPPGALVATYTGKRTPMVLVLDEGQLRVLIERRGVVYEVEVPSQFVATQASERFFDGRAARI